MNTDQAEIRHQNSILKESERNQMTTQPKPYLNEDLSEKAKKDIEQLGETFPGATVPEGFKAFAGSEVSAHDLFMNMKRQLEGGKMAKADKLLLATAVASNCGSKAATQFFGEAASNEGCSTQNISDAIGTAAICSVFNTYYHFRDLAPKEDFNSFRAPFNANTFVQSSLSNAQIESICVTISTLNNCHDCVKAHWKKAQAAGITAEQMDEAIKAGAVAKAFANAVNSLG